jgi:hypothetical protein
MVRDDPRVRQSEKITEAAKMRLMTAVDSGNVRESWRLMAIFSRAVLLQGETEDEVRVRVGLLTSDDAVRRRMTRREDLAEPAGERRCSGLVVTLLTMVATWLTTIAARGDARRDARREFRRNPRRDVAWAPRRGVRWDPGHSRWRTG